MSQAVVLLGFVLFVGLVSGNIIKDDVTSKDVKIPLDDVNINNFDNKDPAKETSIDSVEKSEVNSPAEMYETEKPVKCAEIGQFCMNHSDCCTNACLGYMKRCVSGSG